MNQKELAKLAILESNINGVDSSVETSEGVLRALFAGNLCSYQDIEGVKIRRPKQRLTLPKINVFHFGKDRVDHYSMSYVNAESIEGEEIEFTNPVILN
jgi:hypothetical protein